MSAISTTTVAVIDPFHPRTIETIAEAMPAGWTLVVAAGRSETDIIAAVAPADVLFVMATPVTERAIMAAPQLRFVQKLGAGTDRVDIDACRKRGIAVARLHAGNAVPVAEHTVMMMLAACRRLPYLDRETRAGLWHKEQARGNSRQLNGMTVGLVGFGAIGQRVARVLSGFGVRIIYFDLSRASVDVETELDASFVPLDRLVSESDIVSLHLPFSADSRNLIDEARIAAMKPGAILVNCARGGLVDEAALHRALDEGRLFAAALDTFQNEPPLGSPLLHMDQTVITPHAAGATIDNFRPVIARAVANARDILAGREIRAQDMVLAPPLAETPGSPGR